MLTDLQRTIHPSAPLGHKSPYPTGYDKNLLHPVRRSAQREAMKFSKDLVFKGYDVWNAYELFWHNLRGKPVRAYASFVVPANSFNICESKSVKLYLNSLNHERFAGIDEVALMISQDLSRICEQEVRVFMSHDSCAQIDNGSTLSFRCLDDIDVEISNYQRAPQFLTADPDRHVHEKVVSHLFKSHCLCTGQPDMGSIFIEYQGPKMNEAHLLAYLVSYRDHVGFSENCIEQIFVDIMERVQPEKLLVFGRFTRRGGIDINPYRGTDDIPFDNARLIYQ